jgi:hypothetical protein
LVSDIPAGERKIGNLFYSVRHRVAFPLLCYPRVHMLRMPFILGLLFKDFATTILRFSIGKLANKPTLRPKLYTQ